MATTALSQHPLSVAFLEMQADDFQDIKDRMISMKNSIAPFEVKGLDGWRRYRRFQN